jgi:hypothetical protein
MALVVAHPDESANRNAKSTRIVLSLMSVRLANILTAPEQESRGLDDGTMRVSGTGTADFMCRSSDWIAILE